MGVAPRRLLRKLRYPLIGLGVLALLAAIAVVRNEVACQSPRAADASGFRSALEEAVVELPEEYVHSTDDFLYENGLHGAPRLLTLAQRPPAIP